MRSERKKLNLLVMVMKTHFAFFLVFSMAVLPISAYGDTPPNISWVGPRQTKTDDTTSTVISSPGHAASWTTGGPYGGYINSLAMAETNPDIIYAGTASGAFKTVNGGDTWTRTGFPEILVWVVQAAPDNPDIVYAGTNDGIYKSEDAGSSWTHKGLSGAKVNAIAIDPFNPDTVYAGTGVRDSEFDGSSTDAIFKSTNGGDNWDLKYSIGFDLVHALLIDTDNSSHIYAGVYGNSNNGFLKSTDGGETWQERHVGRIGPWESVCALAMTPAGSNPAAIYAAVAMHDVYKSADRGETWESTGTPFIAYDAPGALAVDLNNPHVIYVGTGYSQGHLYKTTDGGDTWSIKVNGLPKGRPSSIVIDPRDSAVYVGLSEGGVYKSTDAAESWDISSQGINDTFIQGLAVHPTSSDTVFAAIEGSGHYLAKTTNGGTSWDYLVGSSTDLGAVAVDPQTPSTIFVGEGEEHQTSVYTYKSTDGGQSWTGTALFYLLGYTIKAGVSDIWIHRSNSEIVLVAVQGPETALSRGGGVYRSTNGGASWNRKLPGWVTALAADPIDPHIVYSGTAKYAYVYRSTDAGYSWTKITYGSGEWLGDVRDIEVDSDSRVYVATSKELWRWDGTWATLTGLPTDNLTALAIDRSTSPGIIYAGTAGGVFVSRDGGNTWTTFNEGLERLSVTKLAISASQPKILYAGISYGGVWSTALDFVELIGDFCGEGSDQPDGYVDYWDLLYFAQRWHTSPSDTNWDSRCDLDKEDNYVDYWDLLVFAQQWHKGQKL